MMITAKELKKSRVYNDLRQYIEMYVPEPQRAAQLGLLVKRFLARANDEDLVYGDRPNDVRNYALNNVFLWARAPEGDVFWYAIYFKRPVENLNPCPIKRGVAKVAVKKEAPKKKVGWW